MNALFSLFKKRPNIVLLMVLLIGANIVAWLWAFTAFGNNTSLLALSLIAWCYGLRHAVDADHIAAIDSATRKLMQQKTRPDDGSLVFFGALHHCGTGKHWHCTDHQRV